MRAAAERGSGASGTGAAALMAPLLQNLVLSAGDNEELAYCLKAWQALPDTVKTGRYPAKDDALKVCAGPWLVVRTHSNTALTKAYLLRLTFAERCCVPPWMLP